MLHGTSLDTACEQMLDSIAQHVHNGSPQPERGRAQLHVQNTGCRGWLTYAIGGVLPPCGQ